MYGVERRELSQGFHQLGTPQCRVEQQRTRRLPDPADGRMGRGQHQIGCVRAQCATQHRAYPRVLTHHDDRGHHGLRGALQKGCPSRECYADARRVARQGDCVGAHAPSGTRVHVFQHLIADVHKPVFGGQFGHRVRHLLADRVLGRLHDQPPQAAVPVGDQHVRMLGQLDGHLPGSGLESFHGSNGRVRVVLQCEMHP